MDGILRPFQFIYGHRVSNVCGLHLLQLVSVLTSSLKGQDYGFSFYYIKSGSIGFCCLKASVVPDLLL